MTGAARERILLGRENRASRRPETDPVTQIQNYTKTLQDNGEWPTDHNVGATERIASVAAGGALVSLALYQRSPMAWLGGLLGGALLWRGATGHCAVYQAMGRSTSLPHAMRSYGLRTAPTPTEARIDDALDDTFPASDPPKLHIVTKTTRVY